MHGKRKAITAIAGLVLSGAPAMETLADRSDAGERGAPAAPVSANEPGAHGASGPGAYGVHVDADGNISLPDDFATDWGHLGSWAVATDGGVEGIHSVYAPREEIEFFREHQEFRDGAMLVKEVRVARGAAHTTGHAHWGGDVEVWFLMVKDAMGRFPDNPLWGEGWGWALYNGSDRSKQVATDYKKDCLGCHLPAERTDWTYIYAYPVLGAHVARYAPEEEDAASAAAAAMTSMAAAGVRTSMGPSPSATGGAISGEEVFKRCGFCHSLTPRQHGIGPSLGGVFGRKAGSAEGYEYSPALSRSNVVWDEGTLNSHLADVNGFIPGNRMGTLFPIGVQDADERRALIAYLREASKR